MLLLFITKITTVLKLHHILLQIKAVSVRKVSKFSFTMDSLSRLGIISTPYLELGQGIVVLLSWNDTCILEDGSEWGQ